MAIRLYQKFWKKWIVEFFTTPKCERPNHLLNVTCQNKFCFSFIYVFLHFQGQSAKKMCLRFAMYSISVKSYRLNIFEIGFKKYGEFVKKSLSLQNYFERKNSQTHFCCLWVNLPTVKIWRQLDKSPMSFSFLQCPLQIKKLIRENSAK